MATLRKSNRNRAKYENIFTNILRVCVCAFSQVLYGFSVYIEILKWVKIHQLLCSC